MTDETTLSKDELLRRMQAGWDELNRYIAGLSDQQLTVPTDAAGWTVKDHLIHLAIWEDSAYAILAGLSRHDYAGVDQAIWESGDFDRINAVIQQRFHDMPMDVVKRTHDDVHKRLVSKIESLSNEDLHRPYSYFQPGSPRDAAVIGWLTGNSYEHYEEHRPWIEAILGRGG
jgi:uncharacterized protein (TIGR03083 family)